MNDEKIEEYFMALVRKMGGVEEQLKHVATNSGLHKAISKHRSECKHSINPPHLARARQASYYALLSAIAGVVGYLSHLLIN